VSSIHLSGQGQGSGVQLSIISRAVEIMLEDGNYFVQFGDYYTLLFHLHSSPERHAQLVVYGILTVMHMLWFGRGPRLLSPSLVIAAMLGRSALSSALEDLRDHDGVKVRLLEMWPASHDVPVPEDGGLRAAIYEYLNLPVSDLFLSRGNAYL
jgi:hypothetical protein